MTPLEQLRELLCTVDIIKEDFENTGIIKLLYLPTYFHETEISVNMLTSLFGNKKDALTFEKKEDGEELLRVEYDSTKDFEDQDPKVHQAILDFLNK